MESEKAKVKVAVRVRPLNKREIELNSKCVVSVNDGTQVVIKNPLIEQQVRSFTFDHCFASANASDEDQRAVYESVGREVLDQAFQGYNACIFAYGQTGSGKSYTILGSAQQPGIVPRLCNELFERIETLLDKTEAQKVEVSYMEIYNENVYDLLNPENGRRSLRVREHNVMGPFVEGLSHLAVRTYAEVASVIAEGNKSRTVASTNMNAESSRSHSVFTIVLTQTVADQGDAGLASGEKVSKIRLVDLAGSERASKSGATGERLKEGGSINKSLTTLGQVISVLADVASGRRPAGTHVPYRDSALTWLLKDSIGGNSKTAMMATVSPAADNFDESVSTLRYADRAKRIENRAVVNEDANARTIRLLRDEITQLRNQLALAARSTVLSPTPAPALPVVASPTPIGVEQDARERLEVSEALVKELSRTWDDRVRETERTNRMRAEALDRLGVSIADSGIRVDRHKFYLVNLDADPTYDGLLVYYLRHHMLIGSRPSRDRRPPTSESIDQALNGDQETPDIQLDGVGIEKRHCLILIGAFDERSNQVESDETGSRDRVAIEPLGDAVVKVNGKRVRRRTVLKHGDRLLLGMSCSFRLQCPFRDSDANGDADMEERSRSVTNVVESDASSDEMLADVTEYQPGMFVDSVRDALNRHASYVNLFDPTPTSRRSDRPNWVTETLSTRERAFQRSLRALRERIRKANRLARHANFVARHMHVPVGYGVTLQIPADRLRIEDGTMSLGAGTLCEPAIIVRAKRPREATPWLVPATLVRNDQVWSIEKLEFRLGGMCELYRSRSQDVPAALNISADAVHVEFNEAYDPRTDPPVRHDSHTTPTPFSPFVQPEVGEPFCDSNEQHTLIGVANVHLQPLFYDLDFEYEAPIVSQQGEIAGKLRVRLARLFRFPPTAVSPNAARKIDDSACIELADRNEDWPTDSDAHADFALPSADAALADADGQADAHSARLTLGARIGVRVMLVEARDLPAALAHCVFSQYCFYSQTEPVVVAQRPRLDSTIRSTVRFDHAQNFQMRVTGELKEYLESAALAIEVFGNRMDAEAERVRPTSLGYLGIQHPDSFGVPKRSLSRETADALHESVASRMKSIEERWMETSRKVQLWVDVLELNEQGEYAPVPVDSLGNTTQTTAGTGGVYVLRHGHSRRLVVRVAPLAEQTAPTGLSCGSLPVLLDSIVFSQLGCVISRNVSVQKPLDSYQDVDLARVRAAWLRRNDARKAHIDSCLRDFDAQKQQIPDDSSIGPASPNNHAEREKELIEQLMLLAEERNAIQCPQPNSHVPGAELVWQPSPGLEAHIPLVLLQRTDEEGETEGRPSSQACVDSDYGNESLMDDSASAIASNGRYRLVAGASCSLPKEYRPQTIMTNSLESIDSDFVALPIMQTDLLESHNTLYATAQWDAALHESVALNRVSKPSEVLFLVLRIVIRLRQPEACCVMLRKRIAVRVVSAASREPSTPDCTQSTSPAKNGTNASKRSSSGFGSRLAGLFRRSEPNSPRSPSSARDSVGQIEKPTSTGVIYELVWRIPSILDDVEMNRDTLAKLAAESLDDDLDRVGEDGTSEAQSGSASSESENENDSDSDLGESRRRVSKQKHNETTEKQKRTTRYRRLLDSYTKSISAIESLWIVEKLRQELALKEQLSTKSSSHSVSDARKTVLSKTSSTPNLFRSSSLASLQYAPVRPALHHVATGQSFLSRPVQDSKPFRTESVIDLSGAKRRGRASAGEQRSLANQSTLNASVNHGRTARQISVVEEEQNAVIPVTTSNSMEVEVEPEPTPPMQTAVFETDEHRLEPAANTTLESETPDGRDGFVMTSVTSSGYDSHTSTLSMSVCAESLRNATASTDSVEELPVSRKPVETGMADDTNMPADSHVNEPDGELRTIDEDESTVSTHGSSDGADALAEWMMPNQRCRVAVRHGELPLRCTIRFVGKTHFTTQMDTDAVWVGVELESPNGKNDGTVDGVTYFRCRHKHGLFVRPGRILPFRPDGNDLRAEATRRRVTNNLGGSRFGSNPNLQATGTARSVNVEKMGASIQPAGSRTRSSLDTGKRKGNRE